MAANDSTDDRRTERAKPVQRDATISPDQWERLQERVREHYANGKLPMDAWREGVGEVVAATPNVAVDGEGGPRGLEDIDGVPLPEEDTTEWDDLGDPCRERPDVPVFYHVPREAAERAVERFKRRRERVENGAEGKCAGGTSTLHDYLYDEIDEQVDIWVGGLTLAEFASRAGLESMTIDPDELREDADE